MNADRHLTTDEVVVALVDESDLPAAQQSHLGRCSVCRNAVLAVGRPMQAMGAQARQMVPPPGSLPRLPEAMPSPAQPFRWWGYRGWGLAAAAVLLALTFLLDAPQWRSPAGGGSTRVSETAPNEHLLADVALLVENALPREYLAITGDRETVADEGFMEFLDPLPKTNSISEKLRFKGVAT